MSTMIPFTPTKGDVINSLSNRAYVELALLILYARQTPSERATKATIEHNGMGFGQCHAEQGTRAAERIALGLVSGKSIGTIIDADKFAPGAKDKRGNPMTFFQLAQNTVSHHAGQVAYVMETCGSVISAQTTTLNGPMLEGMAKRSLAYYKSKRLPVGFKVAGYLE